MITSTKCFFTAKMLLNGALAQSRAFQTPSKNVMGKLFDGLRIKGEDSETVAAPEAVLSGNAAAGSAENKMSGDVSGKFSSEIWDRCQKARPDSPLAAKMLSDSLVNTAAEIKSKFGADKFTGFISKILAATDSGLGEGVLSATVSGFFKEIASEAQTKPELFQKLESMKNFLNSGLDMMFHEDDLEEAVAHGDSFGLSYALNKFFNTDTTMSADNKSGTAKGFNSSFERVKIGVQDNRNNSDGPWDDYFVLYGHQSVGSYKIGLEQVDVLASYLRDELKNEPAASFFESLGPNDDVMNAIAVATSMVLEDSGQESAEKFVTFLNDNLAPLINSSLGQETAFHGWKLSNSQADPETLHDISKLWCMDGAVADKNHQGLITKWETKDLDSMMFHTVDLEETYAAKMTADNLAAEAAGRSLNQPTGNLIDATI